MNNSSKFNIIGCSKNSIELKNQSSKIPKEINNAAMK